MRYSILVPTLLSIGAIAAPAVLDKRVMETRLIVFTVTTTETIGQLPTSTAGNGAGDGSPDHHHSSWSYGGGYPSQSPSDGNTPASPSSTPASTPIPSPSSQNAPPVVSSTTVAPVPTATAASSSSAPPPAPSSGSGGSPASNGVDMIDTINKWRSAMGLSSLTWSNTLQANAQKTVDDNHGGQGKSMNHELNPGSNAQVLGMGFENMPSGTVQYATGIAANGQSWSQAMGGMTPFELTYVAWLCEKPSAQGLSGTATCSIEGNVLNSHNIEAGTGHFDILTGQYSQIACAFATNPSADPAWPQMAGLWGCDLA